VWITDGRQFLPEPVPVDLHVFSRPFVEFLEAVLAHPSDGSDTSRSEPGASHAKVDAGLAHLAPSLTDRVGGTIGGRKAMRPRRPEATKRFTLITRYSLEHAFWLNQNAHFISL
jgi:hypothetical protein